LDGRAKDWQRFEEVSLVLAGLATLSTFCAYYCIDGLCHVIPGWHTTIFLLIFVAERFPDLQW
jgi:molybdopterin-containing oxidoreductase family membrane subunit